MVTIKNRVILAINALGREAVMQRGDFRAKVNGAEFPRCTYAVACAIYEAARGGGQDAALVDDYRLEVVRRTWGRDGLRGVSP